MVFTFTWDDGTVEEIFSFTLEQAEGDFASLVVELVNPRVGLLSSGRPLWATLAYGAKILFVGRLVALPEDMQSDIISLAFIARPDTFDADKKALAATMRAAPYWDAVWIDPNRVDDPDVVLEARTELWHIDRVTHALTTSSIIEGEAGIVTLTKNSVFYDSVSVALRDPPVSSITCEATVTWEQTNIGFCDLSQRIGAIETLTGAGLTDDWPKVGANIGGGWSVAQASWQRVWDGRWWGVKLEDGATVGFPLWSIIPHFFAKFEAKRQRTETLYFTLQADVQAVTNGREEERLEMKLSSNLADKFVDEIDELRAAQIAAVDPRYVFEVEPVGSVDGKILTTPLVSISSPRYFQTDRGQDSVSYLLCLARARLMARARAVDITFEIPFDVGVDLTLRHSAQILDDRLPGGQATGKIVGYALALSGDSGQARAVFTIGCMIGKGNSLAPTAGSGGYVEAGYVAANYQIATGTQYAVQADLAYDDFAALPIADDGLRVDRLDDPAYAGTSVTVVNGYAAQKITGTFADFSAAAAAINEKYTQVAVALRPLGGGPFVTSFPITVSSLMIPKTIDLEAANGGGP